MADGGVLIYKCRLCGQEDRSVHVPNTLTAICCIINGTPFPRAWGGSPLSLTSVHATCQAGTWGVTDLVGAIDDKKEDSRG